MHSASLSIGLEVFLEPSVAALTAEAPKVLEAVAGAAIGFALAEIPDMPILPVIESNKPPTDEDELMTSVSKESPVIMSPIVCATIVALQKQEFVSMQNIHAN